LGVSGAVLAFSDEIDAFLQPSVFKVTPQAQQLPVTQLAANAAAVLHPGDIIAVYVPSVRPDRSYWFSVIPSHHCLPRQVFVNQYTGKVLGNLSVVRFTVIMKALHNVMAFSSIVLMFLAPSGLYLWWPLKRIGIKTSAGFRRLSFDLHNSLGFFSSLFMFGFAATGAYMVFERWTVPVTIAITQSKPVWRAVASQPKTGVQTISADLACSVAQNALPGASILWVSIPRGGKVLTAASLKKMTTPYKENYGCGLMIHTAKGHLQYEHGGGIEGFNTEMAYYPDDKLTVIVLANLNGGAPGDIAGKLAAAVHGENVVLQSERKEIKLEHDILAKYVGSYELAPGIFIAMSLDGDKFFTQLTGQPKFEVFAETEKDFFLKVVDAQLTFEMDGQGKVTDLVLHQNGRDQTAKRSETGPPPPKLADEKIALGAENASAHTLSAQSSGPFEGKWVFNPEKSSFSPGPFPKSETLTFANGTTTVEGVNGQGVPFLFSFTPVPGRAVHLNGGGELTVETKESGSTVEHTWSDSSGTSHGVCVVSADGKTMRYELTGARWGNPVHEVSVFEKQ
jgi:hypothetical protein